MSEFVRVQKIVDAQEDSVFLWGARQVGKSTLVKSVYPNAKIYDLLKWKAVGITVDLSIPQSLYITEAISTDSVLIYRAIDSIIATNTIQEGANVIYKTSEAIYLRDGFHVKNGAIFRAMIEPCSYETYTTSQRVKSKKNTTFTSPKNSQTQIESKIDIYPNPCHDVLMISNIPNNILTYQIFDIHGKLMKVGHINQTEITLETTYLPSGVYVISLCTKHESIYLKFIKQ